MFLFELSVWRNRIVNESGNIALASSWTDLGNNNKKGSIQQAHVVVATTGQQPTQ